MGNSGLPFERSNAKTNPCLLVCSDGVNRPAVPLEPGERGRRRKVAIPDIVADALEVPDALAGVGLQRNQAVGVEVVARAIRAVEVR